MAPKDTVVRKIDIQKPSAKAGNTNAPDPDTEISNNTPLDNQIPGAGERTDVVKPAEKDIPIKKAAYNTTKMPNKGAGDLAERNKSSKIATL